MAVILITKLLSGDRAEPRDGPRAKERAPYDLVFGQSPPDARIGTEVAIVAHHKVLAVSQCFLRLRMRGTPGRMQVLLLQGKSFGVLPVEKQYAPFFNLYPLMGKPYDALDEKLLRVARISEDDCLSPLGLAEIVRGLVNDEVFPIGKTGLHARPAHHKRLGNEISDG